MSLTHEKQCEYEVEWYRANGKHPSRIRTNSEGMKFVMGDWRWNQDHPMAHEVIDQRVANYVDQRVTGLSMMAHRPRP